MAQSSHWGDVTGPWAAGEQQQSQQSLVPTTHTGGRGGQGGLHSGSRGASEGLSPGCAKMAMPSGPLEMEPRVPRGGPGELGRWASRSREGCAK